QEFTNLTGELTRIAETTTFGGKNLLNGTLTGESFQVGSNAGETLSFSIGDMSAKGLNGQSTLAKVNGAAFGVGSGEGDDVTVGFSVDKLNANNSIKLNDSIVNFEKGDTIDRVVDKINNASTGVTAAKNENNTLQLSSLDKFVIGGDAGGLSALGLTVQASHQYEGYQSTGGDVTDPSANIGAGSFTVTYGDFTKEISFSSGDLASVVEDVAAALEGTGISVNLVDGTTDGSQRIVLTSDTAFSYTENTTLGLADTNVNTTTSITGPATHDVETKSHTIDSLSILTASDAQLAIQALDGAIQQVDSTRADLGAIQNRFESTISNLQNIAENASAARGRIMDTDYAAESANLAKNQIMQQAGTAMLAQANQLPQAVLSLLG